MKLIAYYRVSTKRQGQSGLGLQAQQTAVAVYATASQAEIVGQYTEVESGKQHENRPQLQAALSHAHGLKAVLVVAKLDRLARNVAFTSALMESNAEFICCDQPRANRLTIHILAAVAEDEARRISERTKAALQAAKARGVKLGSAREGHWEDREDRRKLGSRRGLPKAVQAASEARAKRAADAYGFLLPTMREWRTRQHPNRDRRLVEPTGARHYRRTALHVNSRVAGASTRPKWTEYCIRPL